jgi:Type II secretion system (T2SS), protein E, N-terminal domain
MSSTEPFFVDPAQPAPPATPEVAPPAPEPVAAPSPASQPAAGESPAEPSAPMLDVPLGTLIFRAGLLAEEQLEDALQEGMRTGMRLGEVLIARGWLQERDLGRLLAGQKGLPFVEVSASDAEPAALQTLSEEKAKLLVALPLGHEEGRLVVAVADPSNELMLENLRRALGAAPRLVVAPYPDLVRAIGEAYASAPPEAPPAPDAVVAEPETPQAEPEVQPEPQRATQPQPQPEAQAEPQPEAQPEPQPEAQLAPAVQPPPVAEPIQSPAPPPMRPLPIVVRRAEERAKEPAPAWLAPPSFPLLPAAAVEETPEVETPIAEAIETEPPTHEQSAPEPEPVAEPAPMPPAEPEARPVLLLPAPQPVLEPPVVSTPAAEVAAEIPASRPSPAEEPEPQAPAQDETGPLSAVVLRLRAGEKLEVGTFQSATQAAARAEEIVAEIAAAERSLRWPFFAHRYLRPDTIVSVDLIEESPDN